MFVNHGEALRRHLLKNKGWASSLVLLSLLACAALTAHAQNTFSSGSTGADGAFSPSVSQTIVVPDSGVFNYTTVTIPSGVTITYARNTNNKPVTILASGDVLISGSINIEGKTGLANGAGGSGGPGGFNGGAGGYGFDQSFSGIPGDGPGGAGGGIGGASINPPGYGGGGGYSTVGGAGFGGTGGTNSGQGGARYGAVTVLPLIGGSGGGGGAASANTRGSAGGGGGGAMLIASSGTITINGQILARGGNGDLQSCSSGPGGGGSGGAVRFVANTVKGSGTIFVSGGPGTGCFSGQSSGTGGQGFVRVEAFDYSSLTASTSPSNIISFALPHPVTISNAPALRIASVGGINSPSSPLGSLQGVPDIVVPTTQANPVTVALEGANLPVGTIVQVTLTPSRGNRTTVQSTALAGTDAASTASASLSLPTGISVISASAVIDLTARVEPLFMNGERVNRIEVAAIFGGASQVTYVTQSGRRIQGAMH
jgi:hypothetical protein